MPTLIQRTKPTGLTVVERLARDDRKLIESERDAKEVALNPSLGAKMNLTIEDKKKLAALYKKQTQWLRDEFSFYIANSKGESSHPLDDPDNPPMSFYNDEDDPLEFMDFLRQRQYSSETFEDYLEKKAKRRSDLART